MFARALVFVLAAVTVVVAAVVTSELARPVESRAAELTVAAGDPLPIPPLMADADDVAGFNAPPVAIAPPGGAVVEPNVIRIPRPDVSGPRRVGIQVGHWKIDEVPAELGPRLPEQTGASAGGVDEVDVNLDIAQRLAALLEAKGYVVDVLPATVPPGYVADAFVALHADDDGVGASSGFKMAIGRRRGSYDQALLDALRAPYAAATGLEWDEVGISNNMRSYYLFNWSRYQHALSPFTPAVIVEMGFLSSEADRELMTDHADMLASALADGISAFISTHDRDRLFGQDLAVPRGRFVTPTATPVPASSP